MMEYNLVEKDLEWVVEMVTVEDWKEAEKTGGKMEEDEGEKKIK